MLHLGYPNLALDASFALKGALAGLTCIPTHSTKALSNSSLRFLLLNPGLF